MKPTDKQTGTKRSNANHVAPTSDAPASAAARKQRAAKPGNGAARLDERSPYAESLLEMCASTPRLKAFSSAIGTAGLAELLRGDGPLTIFAPTDRAFDKLPGDERDALLGDTERLTDLILHHVVSGRVKAPREKKPRSVTPQFGEQLRLTAEAGAYHVDDARIVKTNIRASNGVIHAIDTVLDPG
jgi:uncharacterized surface protein with fasciclin (FAS1) repeats